MANPVAGIDIVARLDMFEAARARIPEIGGKEAKALAAQMAKEIKSAERAALAAAKASRQAAADTKDFGDRAGTAGQSAAKLAGALGLVAPAAGDAARNVADLADVGEVASATSKALGVSLGTLGVAVAAVTAAVGLGYLAWREYHREAEEAKRKSNVLSESLKTLKPIHDLAAASAMQLAHATGQLSDTELAYQQGLAGAKGARDQVVAATRAQVAAHQTELDAMGKVARTLDGQLVPAAQALVDKISEGTAVITAADEAYGDIEVSLRGVRDATDAAASADERAKRELLDRKVAAEAFTEAVRQMIAEENREFALAKERAKIAESNAKIIADAEARTAERRAEAEISAQARAAKLEADRTAQLEQGLQDRYDLTVEYAEQTISAVEPFLQAISAIVDAQLDARTEALQEVQAQLVELDALLAALSDQTVDAAALSGQALVDAYRAGEVAAEDLTDAQKSAIEAQLTVERDALAEKEAINRAAAEAAFSIQQAASIAATLIAGLQAGVAAFQLGPVAGAAAATGIAALTATNVALIAATKPQFHAGGVGYPDERNSVVLAGEGVLNRQSVNALGGAQAVHAMNASPGAMPGGGGVTVVRIGRHEAREIARTDIRSNGIIPQTVRALSRGSGRGAGLSGGGVVA